MKYFCYGQNELDYLKAKDVRLGAVIDELGLIEREVDGDVFSSLVHHIVGQQISTKAQATIWGRFQEKFGDIPSPCKIAECPVDELQALGLTFRKATYIQEAAGKVQDGSLDVDALWLKSDEVVIAELTALRGVGVWTAEMIMLFCMQRPNILSYDDLAIQRGLRMIYHHRRIDKKLFETHRKRFSPYGSVASLYLWAVAGGAIEGMRDWAPLSTAEKKKREKMRNKLKNTPNR